MSTESIGTYTRHETPGGVHYNTTSPYLPQVSVLKPGLKLTAAEKRRWREDADRWASLMFGALNFTEEVKA